MKKLRVFQTVKIKRIVPGFFSQNLGTVLLILLVIPYLITFLFGNLSKGDTEANGLLSPDGELQEGTVYINNKTGFGSESIPLEVYVADKLARSIDEEFELEALKAQAVLIRSDLLKSLFDEEGNRKSTNTIEVEDGDYGSAPLSENILLAVSQSAGICVTYESIPVSGSYFAVSNGATRNGDELLLGEYPYLKSVLCSRDFLSEDYSGTVSFKEGEFDKLWESLPSLKITEEEILKNEKITEEKELEDISIYRDSVGYVLYLERDGKFAAGEQFREAFRLSSASFHLKKEDDQIILSVKGTGHGLGMSQFGANEMAKEGEDFVKILNYFFYDVTITKFE